MMDFTSHSSSLRRQFFSHRPKRKRRRVFVFQRSNPEYKLASLRERVFEDETIPNTNSRHCEIVFPKTVEAIPSEVRGLSEYSPGTASQSLVETGTMRLSAFAVTK